MPANCSACKNRSNNGSRTTFHKFPAKDKECLKKWVAFVCKARGKGLWKPTVNSKLCSLHFERHCFRYFNGRVYLNSGATPTVFDVPGYLLKGTRNALPSIAAEALSEEESENQGSKVVEEKAFDYEGNPLKAKTVQVAKLELSRLDEEQLRRALVPPANSTPGQRMSAEAKESDGKRPIIVHVTSLSNESSSRPTRLKRLPEKLRSGDYDREFNEEPPKKVLQISPKLDDSELGISDDEYLGSESEDLDAPDLEEDEFEVSDAESPPLTSSPSAESRPVTSTPLQGTKALPQDGKADSAAGKPASSTTAGTLVELCTKLHQQRARNEELTKQLADANAVINKQNKNIEALEEVINGLRRRIVAMSSKLSSDGTATDVSGGGKG